MGLNTTCNATLDDLRIGSSEIPIVGEFTFHSLAILIAAACTLIAILVSFYLIWMHALHYTKPYEQRHIIRILFMIPIYATASFLSLFFYWHAIYFSVIQDCYEAFAIASFFALLCHYVAPTLHEQKEYFRGVTPKKWVWPMNWMAKCCGGERGIWRTPRSGLTWFNIIWSGIYQYCFIRVTMTVTAVVTQYFGRYCESSNSPVFAHIWILVVESIAVTIAMYCVIQFYVQLRKDLAQHSPFLKVLAIKLVVFLSFWQTFLISILTSTLNIINPSSTIAYPDIKVGIPALLLCTEMAIFSILHLFAFPWKPYSQRATPIKYPLSEGDDIIGPKQGGFLGIKAFVDSMNPWDLVKAFARGMRWLIVGAKHRETDRSYQTPQTSNDMTLEPTKNTLPIANEFRRSNFGIQTPEEHAHLISNAQPSPLDHTSGYIPARQRYDSEGQDISAAMYHSDNIERYASINPDVGKYDEIGMAVGHDSRMPMNQEGNPLVHNALWGSNKGYDEGNDKY